MLVGRSGSARVGSLVAAAAVVAGVLVASPAAAAAPAAPAGPGGPAAPLPTVAATLRVMTFNICKITCPGPAPSWRVRRARVVRVLRLTRPDVVGFQEATDQKVYGRRTQWQDLQAALRPVGYAASRPQADRCSEVPCTHTARLAYDRSRVAPVRIPGVATSGSTVLGRIAPGLDPGSASRQVSWAYLAPRSGGRAFLAVSLHLPHEEDSLREAARVSVGRSLAGWVEALNASRGLPGAPAVLLGDLNSYDTRQPQGIQRQLVQTGWADAWSAPARRNIRFSTVNYTPDTRRFRGWPPRPRRYAGPATRVDYVMGLGGLQFQRYRVVVRRTRSGHFDRRYQASDHQPVVAVATLPAAGG